ncbi:hypothetical protein GLOIN_2v1485982 [Rhizophagus irregularis DAOM 181602=DAOM 197198]|uniref:Transmembrane protein n=1 Tax=Rhizophagus irregularis (strain DAOM 181602 / DAOM 197198 / MUCL 43194) TaxID=747089 RepID=A0A2P4P8R1_RHIID|nr:hypothetical protein GLOIN_2v1485982 [Rhizophagus irregularis DAOM 181602=DAOM 197198]POG61771.1 hypothetical protein GLOIN_2v1485982 [Rhizophagus irregularis DAOM 181602=DAOM 197198]|eukprot:XP_025168637.1 hypothetical protein GLOIN_2v1485982 [Rhizophagus irregularis DAOM 181602=DAOM 197198]
MALEACIGGEYCCGRSVEMKNYRGNFFFKICALHLIIKFIIFIVWFENGFRISCENTSGITSQKNVKDGHGHGRMNQPIELVESSVNIIRKKLKQESEREMNAYGDAK